MASAPVGSPQVTLDEPLGRRSAAPLAPPGGVAKPFRTHVRPISQDDLAAIAGVLPPAPNRTHADDLAWQHAGAVTELIAWLDSVPVGAGFIHWSGPRHPSIAVMLPTCPEIFRLEVLERHRSQGVGAAIVRDLETLARARGHALVGLGVGVANERARLLYERLGYRVVSASGYVDRWTYPGPAGRPCIVEEPCVFMTRALEPPRRLRIRPA